ncbi:MucBP domain-containing protein [Vagococcus sp. BWB3-3]|uniref:MucBP domain-containing protein n=1 Tax=Vagococcus allomyrinae TaxID=2794353 RepID=A0A940SQT9_9ENTE|nr:MucBP domain-containing protein [Vagococcus allomyrinae]MBP1040077.1 MucBP domain-containing protein [Vagococcus allomyrinae]
MKKTTKKWLFLTLASSVFLASSQLVKAENLDEVGVLQTQNSENQSDNSSLMSDPLEELKQRNTRNVNNVPELGLSITDLFYPAISHANSGIAYLDEGRTLQITSTNGSESGAIWSKNRVSMKYDFDLKSYLYLGNSQKNAGDGMTFTLQNDPRMSVIETSDDPADKVIGHIGQGLGIYSGDGVSHNKYGSRYVQNAFSMEFDLFLNARPTYQEHMDMDMSKLSYDQPGNDAYNKYRGHMGFVRPQAYPGNNQPTVGQVYPAHHLSPQLATAFLSNGYWKEYEMTWDAATFTLSYTVRDVLKNAAGTIVPQATNVYKNSYKFNSMEDVAQTFGYSAEDVLDEEELLKVHWGFSGSTGGSVAQQALSMSRMPGLENVSVKYVDTKGNELAESQENIGELGEDYTITPDTETVNEIQSNGYTLLGVDGQLTGKYKYQEDSVVTLVFAESKDLFTAEQTVKNTADVSIDNGEISQGKKASYLLDLKPNAIFTNYTGVSTKYKSFTIEEAIDANLENVTELKLTDALENEVGTATVDGTTIKGELADSATPLALGNLRLSYKAVVKKSAAIGSFVRAKGTAAINLQSTIDQSTVDPYVSSSSVASNEVSTKVIAGTGEVEVQYVDQTNQPIKDPATLDGDIGSGYDATSELVAIADYTYVGDSGNVTGTYTEEIQTVYFKYVANADVYGLTQKVFNSKKESIDGGSVKQGESVSYELTLSLAESVSGLAYNYQSAVFSQVIDDNLMDIKNIKLTDTSGTISEVGSQVGNTISVSLPENTDLAVANNLVLSFEATVKETTPVDEKIYEEGTADVLIAIDGLTSTTELTSNKVVTTVKAGRLEFISAPASVTMAEKLNLSTREKIYDFGLNGESPLVVQDFRDAGSQWRMEASVVKDMTHKTDTSSVLTGGLMYGDQELTTQSKTIKSMTTEDNDAVKISDEWQQGKGLRLKVKPGAAKSGVYEGTIRWTLIDAI